MQDDMTLKIIAIVSMLVAASLALVLIAFATKHIKALDEIRSLKRDVANLEKTDYKTWIHQDHWNHLWAVIRDKFNIYVREDKSWHGGQQAKEIQKLLKTNYGKYSVDQIMFLTNLVTLLKGVTENQKEYEMLLTPINKEIVFTSEGGFKVITTPSLN